jgi:hypothetical protein
MEARGMGPARRTDEGIMAQTTNQVKTPAYTVYEAGRPIGQVVEPRGERVVGRGEGTVLLKR